MFLLLVSLYFKLKRLFLEGLALSGMYHIVSEKRYQQQPHLKDHHTTKGRVRYRNIIRPSPQPALSHILEMILAIRMEMKWRWCDDVLPTVLRGSCEILSLHRKE